MDKLSVLLNSFNIGEHIGNSFHNLLCSGACPGICKGGWQNLKAFILLFIFFAFQVFRGGPAKKIAEKMAFSTKKVAKYR